MIAVSDTLYVNPHHVGSVFADEEGIILIVQGVRHTLFWTAPNTPVTRGREFRKIVRLIEESSRESLAA